jgi:capsular polysaccharide biosynthesis protein
MSTAAGTVVVDPFPVLDGDSPFVDVPRLLGALRRRWRVLALACVLGLLGGVLLSAVAPPPSSASTSVMLDHPASIDPTRGMENDMQLVSSSIVARRAMERLGISGSTADFVATYTPKNLSDSILQITVDARTEKEAVRRATAIVTSFLEFRSAQFIQQARAVLAALVQRGTQLQEQLSGIESGDATLSVDAAGSDVSGLLERQRSLSTELVDIRRRMQDTVDETSTVVRNSTVVDPPSATAPSRLKSLGRETGAALLVAFALAAGAIILQETISNRVRRRHDVVVALGVPIHLSLGALPGAPRLPRRLRGARAPGSAKMRSDLGRLAQHLRSQLPVQSGSSTSLLVVSINTDHATALAVALAARQMAAEDRTVLMVDLTRRSTLARLLEAPLTGTTTVQGGIATIRITCTPDEERALGHPATAGGRRAARDHADVVLVMGTIDPALGADHLSAWATSATAVVTAGRSTPSALRAASQVLHAAGIHLASAVLVDADPQDETTGIPDTTSGAPSADPSHTRWVTP